MSGGVTQLLDQLLGSALTCIATLVVSLAMMLLLKKIGILHVSKADELEGLDLHEHGAAVYPKYALVGAGSSNGTNGHGPAADVKETVLAEE